MSDTALLDAQTHPTSSGRFRLHWLALWVPARVFILMMSMLFPVIYQDIQYYFSSAHSHGLRTGMGEYPFPIAVLLMAPARAVGLPAYKILFCCAILAIDLCLSSLLARRYGHWATRRWIIFSTLLGPAAYLRFDILVAVAMFALAWNSSLRPIRSGAWSAIGSAVKLWPAILGIGLTGSWRTRLLHMMGALIGGAFWVGVTAVVCGWARVTSPLTWQSTRGFQIESFEGSILGVLRGLGLGHLTWAFHNHSVEYRGDAAQTLIDTISLWQKIGFLVVLVLLALTFRKPRTTAEQLTRNSTVLLAVPLVLILTSAVFSPQYLMWLAPGLVLNPHRGIRRLGYIAALLTQIEMPAVYIWTFFSPSRCWLFADVVLLRNLVLGALLLGCLLVLVREPRRSRTAHARSTD